MASNVVDENDAWRTFFWKIENCPYFWEDKTIESPDFSEELTEKTIWKIILHPPGRLEDNFVPYYLCGSCIDVTESTEYEYDLAILADDGSILQMNERERIKVNKMHTLGSEFLLIRTLFQSQDTLNIRCRLWRTDGKVLIPVTFFARTSARVEKRDFFWNLELFSTLGSDQTVSYVIKSATNDDIMVFNIKVEKDNTVSVTIKSSDQEEFFLKFRSFIIDTNGGRIDCGEMTTWPKIEDKVVCTLPFTKKYLMDNKDLYLKDDVLTLYCECSWSDGDDINRIERINFGLISPRMSTQAIPKQCICNAVVEQMDDLKLDFESLFSKSILSDVKLRTATRTFEAHKNILSARSPVFRAMFTTDMKEKIQEIVEVSDLEDDTLHRMLLYMYTNALKGLEWESALKLYAAADKYEIDALKRKCSTFLKSNLRTNNVCDVLILADMHADVELKKTVQDYILKHEHEVYCSDEWKVLAKNNSLAVETMLLKWNTHK